MLTSSVIVYIAPRFEAPHLSLDQLGLTLGNFVPPADMYPHERRSLECLMGMSDSENVVS